LRLKNVRDGLETHVFNAELVEKRLEVLRRARCTCCYSRGGLRVAFDNPDGKNFNLRSKDWRRTADNVITEFKYVPQLQLELGDTESSSYVDLIWRFTRKPPSPVLCQRAFHRMTTWTSLRSREASPPLPTISLQSRDQTSHFVDFPEFLDYSHENRSLRP